ncbi:C6 finger domain [Pyrenophora seminiperda CCB06]|uniref:C6 finger domain n=1 Tax=Pyrenophora seminiperda CCB06 TaxID=1302712 RepID=A0A3M7MFP9_9PLEO|nr:C6 finger domain [Pyrenophora seminiperda CCB06]
MAEIQPASSAGPGDTSPTALSGSVNNSKMRKRTKTGCLTCRKRRIKCGEERPTCANCIKSKRQCEGYNQRVIFKPPIGDWPNHPGVVSTIQYHTSMLPGTRNQPYRGPESSAPMQENMLASIQPRPLGDFNFSPIESNAGAGSSRAHRTFIEGNPSYANEQSYQQALQSPPHHQPLASPHHQTHNHMSPASYFPQHPVAHTSPPAQFSQSSTYQTPSQYTPASSYPTIPVPYTSTSDLKPPGSHPIPRQPIYQPPYRSDSLHEGESSYRRQPSASPPSNEYPQYTETRPGVQRYNTHSQVPMQSPLHSSGSGNISQAANYSAPHADYSHSSYSSAQMPIHDISPDVKYMPQPVLVHSTTVEPIGPGDEEKTANLLTCTDPARPTFQSQKYQPYLNLSGFGGEDHVSPTQVLDEAAVEYEDNDYWDVQSDEDMFDAEPGEDEHAMLASKEFNNIRRIHLENFNELGIRRYDAFLYDGLLTHYKPEYAANPLRNPKTARVFAHYIHVTGPTISIFDRNSRNPTLIFEDETPPAQQGLWTHILPLKALSHQGLLHAMLALASLHIARLQGASITPSYKHYAYSLKRLVRSLGHPKKRLSILTLATSILLACYEVWTAEHVKWGTHLIGAQRLIDELDFRSLTREARRLRAAQTAMMRQFPYQNPEMLIDQKQFNQKLKESVVMPDEHLVSTIVGKKVSYDDFGMVFEDNGARHDTRPKISEKLDLQSYDTLQDLCWAYARHDVYQSIVSGHRLINPYRKWSDCPPRAPFGQIDSVYGTHDHIVLLLARIADFTVRDRERKLRQAEADGGWRPRPGMPGFGNMAPPPNGPPNQQQTQKATTGPPAYAQGPPHDSREAPRSRGTGQPPMVSSSQGRPTPSAIPQFYGMAPSPGLASVHSSYENPNFQRSPPTPNTPHPGHADLPTAYEHAVLEWQTIVDAHTKVVELLEQADGFAPLPEDILPPAPGGQSQRLSAPFGPPILYRSYDISIIWMMIHLSKIILLRSHPGMPAAATMAAGVCASATAPYGMLICRIAVGMQTPVTPDLSPFLGAVLTESTMPLFFAGVTFQNSQHREWLITRLLEIDKRTGWASAGIIARGCETAWEKAAEMGRAPPYVRRTNPIRKTFENGQYVDRWEDDGTKMERNWVQKRQADEQETRFVVKSGWTGTWAVNLLGTEEDLRMGMEKFGL